MPRSTGSRPAGSSRSDGPTIRPRCSRITTSQALELAEASGAEATALGGSARIALRDAGDRAASLYAIEAADRFYDAALRLWPEGDPERADLLLRRAHPTDGWEVDPERVAEARDALLAVGEAAKASEAEMLLSGVFWHRGQPDLSAEHAARAEALLEGAQPSRSTSWVLTRLATRASLAGDQEASIEFASQALEQAEQLGWDSGIGHALSPLGMARVEQGDGRGIQDYERSIEIASAAGELGTLSHQLNNLSVAYWYVGDLDAAGEARLEAARLAARIGSASEIRWYSGTVSEVHFRRGAWDEALRMVDDFIVSVEAGSPHYTSYQSYAIRGEIRMGRGEHAGVTSDAENAVAHGREMADPQAIYYALAVGAHLFSLVSLEDRALLLARELIDAIALGEGLQVGMIALPSFSSAALRLGIGDELATALASQRETPWTEVANAYLRRDFAAAAELLQRIGSRPDEAEARLQAAQQLVAEGRRPDEQLQRALELYREMGATHYLRECEALLPASA